MEIKTKFGIGDSVWGVKDRRAYRFEVSAIIIDGNSSVMYRDDEYDIHCEFECFASKEELRDWFMGGE